MAKILTPLDLAKSGTEHSEQKAFFCWLLQNNRAVWEHAFAIPNGGMRDEITAGKLKAEGVKRGVPDVMIAWPVVDVPVQFAPTFWRRESYAGLFIEMKRSNRTKKTAGKTVTEQDVWHARLRSQGYRVDVAWTWQEAGAAVLRYFAIPETAPVWATLVARIEG